MKGLRLQAGPVVYGTDPRCSRGLRLSCPNPTTTPAPSSAPLQLPCCIHAGSLALSRMHHALLHILLGPYELSSSLTTWLTLLDPSRSEPAPDRAASLRARLCPLPCLGLMPLPDSSAYQAALPSPVYSSAALGYQQFPRDNTLLLSPM